VANTVLCGGLARKTAVVLPFMLFGKHLVASVEVSEERTLSMGDMAESVPDAPTPVTGGWSR
jgi:hypothetical protein